jgi:deoxycytidine triphosphate deaminase
MLITGKEIEKNYLTHNTGDHKVNQVGIDLSVKKIEKILGGIMVLKDKTIIKPESYQEIELSNVDRLKMWRLEPGSYALTFNEGINIPANAAGFIQSRSSIYRGGSIISSPVFDNGFTTGENTIGTIMITTVVIFIEENARVGQLVMHESHVPDELYSGQYQGKGNY